MRHGIDGYFDGLARDRLRVSRIGIVVTIAFLALEFAARQPDVVGALNDPKRFGYEGSDQYVRRILLEQVGEVDQPGASMRNVVPVELRAGGGLKKRRAHASGNVPGGERVVVGPGEDERSLTARLRALALEGPVIRSEELVVEKLVKPEYPEEARVGDVEGIVEMVALVDTTGAVAEVHIIGGTRQPLLERAATTAALQCRYRPYRLKESTPQRVWAYFRVNFTLY